jgi:B12-binding domain/radical SAM domain protein of rhizo-twelve system
MKIALLSPPWSFQGSTYFGCRSPHLPLELGCCEVLLRAAGHETMMLDGHFSDLDMAQMAALVADFAPGMTVVTTAPSYLFWRCAQPELRVPRAMIEALDNKAGLVVGVGPHGSATPRPVLQKLGAHALVRGECEETILALAEGGAPGEIAGTAVLRHGMLHQGGGPVATEFTHLPALRWPDAWIARHAHHHHRFDGDIQGAGAEVEASRGCPYHCSFCAKIDFRDAYRRRDLPILLEEIDALIAQGVRYVYFIDEIFLPNRPLLEALAERPVKFGIQTRIDLFVPAMLELLGRAGCVSIEAGVESLTQEGRASLDKQCRMTTDALAERLIEARRHVPFVQANLIQMRGDEAPLVQAWRRRLQAAGVWANEPVPLYPYPSSPDYHRLFGAPDDRAWERAHAYYLDNFSQFSDIQDDAPLPLPALECACGAP